MNDIYSMELNESNVFLCVLKELTWVFSFVVDEEKPTYTTPYKHLSVVSHVYYYMYFKEKIWLHFDSNVADNNVNNNKKKETW